MSETPPAITFRLQSVDEAAPQWEQLAARTQALPWLHPWWLKLWERYLGEGPLVAACLWEGNSLRAVLPLEERRWELRSPAYRELPWVEAVAEDGWWRAELYRDLLAVHPRALNLVRVPPQDAGLLRELFPEAGYLFTERLLGRALAVDLSVGWEAYERSLGRRHRQDIRRQKRRLEERGKVEVLGADAFGDLDLALERMFAIELAGWKGDRGTAMASRPETEAYFRSLARQADRRGELDLLFLTLDGAPIAFDLGLIANGVRFCVKESFLPEYAKFGPGGLLNYLSLASAFERGLRRFELLGFETPAKLHWTREGRSIRHMRAYPRSWPGRGRFWVRSLARSVRKMRAGDEGRSRTPAAESRSGKVKTGVLGSDR